jgi:hypothetical protein
MPAAAAAFGTADRREFAIVFALAFCGIASVLVVAFAPWYESGTAGGTDPSVARRPTSAASAGEVGDGPLPVARERP